MQSYLDREFGKHINGKIIKSSVDFDSYEELIEIIKKFNPDTIGVSAMTFHKDFFHDAIKQIRNAGFKKTIITGGPHPTTSYEEVLNDKNIDICVLGEGEATLAEIIKKLISKKNENFVYEDLININGIAFSRDKFLPNLIDQKAAN